MGVKPDENLKVIYLCKSSPFLILLITIVIDFKSIFNYLQQEITNCVVCIISDLSCSIGLMRNNAIN